MGILLEAWTRGTGYTTQPPQPGLWGAKGEECEKRGGWVRTRNNERQKPNPSFTRGLQGFHWSSKAVRVHRIVPEIERRLHGPSWKLDFLLHKCASLPQPKVSEERWKMHSAACPGHCWGDSGGLVLTHVGTALGGAGLRVRESITDQGMLGSGSSLGSNPPPPGELSPSP